MILLRVESYVYVIFGNFLFSFLVDHMCKLIFYWHIVYVMSKFRLTMVSFQPLIKIHYIKGGIWFLGLDIYLFIIGK